MEVETDKGWTFDYTNYYPTYAECAAAKSVRNRNSIAATSMVEAKAAVDQVKGNVGGKGGPRKRKATTTKPQRQRQYSKRQLELHLEKHVSINGVDGTITKSDATGGTFKVKYNNGDEEDVKVEEVLSALNMYDFDKKEEEETKSLPLATATKATKSAAAAATSTRKLRSHSTKKKASGKASPAKASSANAKHTVVAKSGPGKAVRMTLPGGRKVRRVPAPNKKVPPGMKYFGKRLVADFSEEEDDIIRNEVAAGTSQKEIAELLSKGKKYTRRKYQVRGRIAFLGLEKSSGVTNNMIRPDTELGKKLIALFHVIKDMQDEGEKVNVLQMCIADGIQASSNGYRKLLEWLRGKELPKALLTDKRSVANRETKGKKKAAAKKAAKPQELETGFY